MLEQVVEKASGLAQAAPDKKPLEIRVHWTPPEPPVFAGPHARSVEVAVRAARVFLRPDEPVSFESLAEVSRADPELSDRFKRDVEKVRKRLTTTLAGSPPLRVRVRDQTPPTYGEILDVFLRGSLEHVGDGQRAMLESWLAQPATAMLLRSQFQTALEAVCRGIQDAGEAARRELLRAAG